MRVCVCVCLFVCVCGYVPDLGTGLAAWTLRGRHIMAPTDAPYVGSMTFGNIDSGSLEVSTMRGPLV